MLLLDARHQVVFANDEALVALQPGQQDQSDGCGSASVMQNMQCLIARYAANDNAPVQFNYAGRSWHSISFSLPNGENPEVMRALVSGPAKASKSHAATFGKMFRLTPRETEALELFMKGFSVKETAARMKISSSTAKAFLRLITIKMGVSGRSELMSSIMSYMCASSLACPFRTSPPAKTRTNPND